MPDLLIQHVDSLLVERIRSLAKERQCSVNDILLQALRSGLGVSGSQEFTESLRDAEAMTVLSGNWDRDERVAFQEALQALSQTSPTQLAPERIRSAASPEGDE